MFAKFKYSPSPYYGGQFNLHVQKGRDIFEATSSKVRKDLKEFILNNGHIDGTALKEHWFPTINADIFLSHSHSDLEKVKGFAGWLFDTFGLTSFIDSCVWGYDSRFLCLGVEIDRNKERGSFLGRGVHFFGQGFILGVRGSTPIFFGFFRGLDAPTSKDELSEIAWSRELLSLEGRFFVLIESVSGSD